MRGIVPPDKVLVLYSNTDAYQQKRIRSGRLIFDTTTYSSTQKLRSWLRRHAPKAWGKETYFPSDWNLPALGEVYSFQDPRAAMLFKLTFGGQ